MHGDSVWTGHKQKVASLSRLEIIDLPLRQIERPLELYCLGALLAAQQKDAGIRGQDSAILGFKKVSGILADEDQTAAVFSDATRKTDKKTADRLVLQKQANLIDEKMARLPVAS